jgi:glycosyltransferase involved in cell wall biosynthesis
MLRELGNALPMDRVHFLGVLPNAQYLKLLQVSACHVYFTYPFVMSWSAVEAMSVGCAIVASDTPPVRDFITHGEQGLLVDFFDRPALVNAVCDVLAYPERLANMRAAARQRVFEQFDLAKVCLPRQLKLLLEA